VDLQIDKQGCRWRQHISLKHWYLSTRPFSVSAQKTNNDIYRVKTHKTSAKLALKYENEVWMIRNKDEEKLSGSENLQKKKPTSFTLHHI
jgi:hypothetical protein